MEDETLLDVEDLYAKAKALVVKELGGPEQAEQHFNKRASFLLGLWIECKNAWACGRSFEYAALKSLGRLPKPVNTVLLAARAARRDRWRAARQNFI